MATAIPQQRLKPPPPNRPGRACSTNSVRRPGSAVTPNRPWRPLPTGAAASSCSTASAIRGELGLPEIGPFLASIAHTEKNPLRALAASRAALDFLDREVLHLDLGELPQPRPLRLPDQVRQVLRVRH